MADDSLYERHIRPMEPRLIAAAWRVLGNEQDAGDALQEALARIWHHREQLETHLNPPAWMLRIVLNAAYDRLRRRRKHEPLPPDFPSSAASPESRMSQRETRSRLLNEIARLSPRQAQAVLLRLVEEMPYDAIAAALGCTEATARVHVQRGRQRLRNRLGDLQPMPQRSQP